MASAAAAGTRERRNADGSVTCYGRRWRWWRDAELPQVRTADARIAGDSIKVVVVNLPDSVVRPVYDDEDEQSADVWPVSREASTIRGEWLN